MLIPSYIQHSFQTTVTGFWSTCDLVLRPICKRKLWMKGNTHLDFAWIWARRHLPALFDHYRGFHFLRIGSNQTHLTIPLGTSICSDFIYESFHHLVQQIWRPVKAKSNNGHQHSPHWRGIKDFERALAHPVAKDQIIRFGGNTDPSLPWPEKLQEDHTLETTIQRTIQKSLQKMLGKSKLGSTFTDTEGSSSVMSSSKKSEWTLLAALGGILSQNFFGIHWNFCSLRLFHQTQRSRFEARCPIESSKPDVWFFNICL